MASGIKIFSVKEKTYDYEIRFNTNAVLIYFRSNRTQYSEVGFQNCSFLTGTRIHKEMADPTLRQKKLNVCLAHLFLAESKKALKDLPGCTGTSAEIQPLKSY